jgi:antitoxin (DNA-binding transcriptional repressor) of toxin-antitoxin stability system
MYYMRIINVRKLQHNLREVINEVAAGETVEITRNKKVVAKMVPPEKICSPEKWPDLEKRLEAIFPRVLSNSPGSDTIYNDRG